MSIVPMPTVPNYIGDAFHAVQVLSIDEYIQQDIRAFAEHWGGMIC